MPGLAESRYWAGHLSRTSPADIPRRESPQPSRPERGLQVGRLLPRGDPRPIVRRPAPARAGRGRPAGVAAALGPAGRAGGRAAAGGVVPAAGDLAAGRGGPRAAHGGAGGPEPAGLVRLRAGVRGGLLLPAAVLGAERLVVRV